MTTRIQKIRLGVFMLLAMLLLLGTVGTLAGLKMWNPRDRFFARFRESISGLEVGSTVKMRGVRVGQVERINISKDGESVIVTLALDPGVPITDDTRAVLTSIGITGLQFVELSGGSALSKRVPPNTSKSIIKPGRSTLKTLTGKATDIAFKMEALLNNLLRFTTDTNQGRVEQLLDSITNLAVSWEKVAQGNDVKIRKILSNLETATVSAEKASNAVAKIAVESSSDLRVILSVSTEVVKSLNRTLQNFNPQATLTSINNTAESIRKRVDDPAITKVFTSMSTAAAKLTRLIEETEQIIRQRDRQIGVIMNNFDQASYHFKDFARSIKERPSLLLRGDTRKER